MVDFAELLLRTFELLSKHLNLLQHYQARFKYILVDEFQDTNKLQYRWIKLLGGTNGCVFAVGDDDQCLAGGHAGHHGGRKPQADRGRPARRSRAFLLWRGDFGRLRSTDTMRRACKSELVEIRPKAGRRIVSTPEHTHFAGYLLGETPQTYFTYLMYKKDVGYRLGTSWVYTQGQAKPMVGFKQRSVQEHADATWIVGTHASENDARFDEIALSLKYGMPTFPFVPREGGAVNGLVHDAVYIRACIARSIPRAGRARLLVDRELREDEPHHVAQSRDSKRRNVMVTLCGDRRGASPMHRDRGEGNDARKAGAGGRGIQRQTGEEAVDSWRVETVARTTAR